MKPLKRLKSREASPDASALSAAAVGRHPQMPPRPALLVGEGQRTVLIFRLDVYEQGAYHVLKNSIWLGIVVTHAQKFLYRLISGENNE